MTSALGPIAAQRARNARILAQAESIAAAHAVESPGAPVVLLPANTRPLVPLPDAARQAFRQHLAVVITRAFADPVRDNAESMSAEETGARADAGELPVTAVWGGLSPELVGQGCATCLGSCCTAGGTHAFLKVDSLARVRARMSEVEGQAGEAGAGSGEGTTVDAATITARYLTRLPAEHYRGSCVYHASGGCALPRDLRSNLCNRYQCGGLTQLGRAMAEGETSAAYVGAADSVRLRRMARVGAGGAVPLPVTG